MHMQHTNFHVRIVFCGVVLGMGTLLGGCHQTGDQSATGQQAAPSTPAAPSPGTAVTSAKVVAYVPGTMPAKLLSSCNLEAVGTVKFGAQPMPLKSSEKKEFMGWIDASALTQPAYWLRFDSQLASRYVQVPVTLTAQRPDVASTHAGAPLVSGFEVDLPAGSLPDGKYHVYLAAEAGGTIYVCDNGRYVTVAS